MASGRPAWTGSPELHILPYSGFELVQSALNREVIARLDQESEFGFRAGITDKDPPPVPHFGLEGRNGGNQPGTGLDGRLFRHFQRPGSLRKFAQRRPQGGERLAPKRLSASALPQR